MCALLELPHFARTLTLDPPLTDGEFERMCLADTILQLERTKEGAIVVNPPTAGFTGDSNREIS